MLGGLLLSGLSLEEAIDVMIAQPKPGENDVAFTKDVKSVSNSVKTMNAYKTMKDSPSTNRWRHKSFPGW